MADKVPEYRTIGRRKTATARVRLSVGSGKITVNGQEARAYFSTDSMMDFIEQPFKVTDTVKQYDVIARLAGGGKVGQAGALQLGIARALVQANGELKERIKAGGFLTRDARMKERKKYGQPGARKRFQFSKR